MDHTQGGFGRKDGETYFRIRVQLNFELERVILGFGDWYHSPQTKSTENKK